VLVPDHAHRGLAAGGPLGRRPVKREYTFTAGGLTSRLENGGLTITGAGKFKKFVKKIEHVTFSGKYAARSSRYTTSAFLRMKLGASLEKRGVSPHIYESKTGGHLFLLFTESIEPPGAKYHHYSPFY
jgi:hypothetical protein